MKWEGREESVNVEDRRGLPAAGGMVVGGGMGTLVMVLLMLFLGMNPMQLLEQPGWQQGEEAPVRQIDPQREQAEAPIKSFVGVVFRDTEDVWTKLFRDELGRAYQKPKLVVYTDQVQSACGVATSASGPFYCPGDQNVYLDFAFFQELQQRFHAKGEFAMAYVIAHEVGHHVQQQLGITNQVSQMQRSRGPLANQMSVRLELQADFLAGVWAHHLQKYKGVLEKGDLEDALNAAVRIGDDVLQKQIQGHLRPESYTHGTAEQRKRWLKEGIVSGDVNRMMEIFKRDYEDL